jgi:hypothetical protein
VERPRRPLPHSGLVSSLSAEQWAPQALYEELYCARGEMENRIKEQFSLFAERVSSETMRANQMRMYFSAMAYVLVCGLRLGVEGHGVGKGASGPPFARVC